MTKPSTTNASTSPQPRIATGDVNGDGHADAAINNSHSILKNSRTLRQAEASRKWQHEPVTLQRKRAQPVRASRPVGNKLKLHHKVGFCFCPTAECCRQLMVDSAMQHLEMAGETGAVPPGLRSDSSDLTRRTSVLG